MNNLDPQIILNPNRVKIMFWLKKIIAITLIIYPLYYLYLSVRDLIFVFPKLAYLPKNTGSGSLYLNLVKRAILISTGLFLNTFYGFSLLIKPGSITKIIHLVSGVLLFLLSYLIFQSNAIDSLLQNIQFFPLT